MKQYPNQVYLLFLSSSHSRLTQIKQSAQQQNFLLKSGGAKPFVKKKSFSPLLKCSVDFVALSVEGMAFHRHGAAAQKARSPMVLCLILRKHVLFCGMSNSLRYWGGTKPWTSFSASVTERRYCWGGLHGIRKWVGSPFQNPRSVIDEERGIL